jgi:large subunit ribosomal protein L7/L12
MNMQVNRLWSPDVRELGIRLARLNGRQAEELVDYLDEVHGIQAPAVVSVSPCRPEAQPDPQPICCGPWADYRVTLEGLIDPGVRVSLMKALRQVRGLSLQEAREMLEGLPRTVAEGLEESEAARLQKILEEAGGRVHVTRDWPLLR